MKHKKTGNKTVNKNRTNMLQTLETEFKQAPAKLSAQINTELTGFKQTETQLKTQITKAKSQLQQIETRLTSATKNKKTTASSKKAAVQAQKALKTTTKMISDLYKQLQANTKQLNTAKIKQARLAALRKHLGEFEKTWSKQAAKLVQAIAAKEKAEQTKAKAKKTKVTKKRKTSGKKATTGTQSNTQTQQQVETFNDSLENTGFRETTEADMA